METAITLAELFQKSDRIYLGQPDKPTPLLKWEPSLKCNVALLFQVKHILDVRAACMEYITGFIEFANNFNESCRGPMELVPAESFSNWPADPFEIWIGKTHKYYTLTANTYRDLNTAQHTIAIDVGGVVEIDLDEYRDRYAQALLMRKMAQ